VRITREMWRAILGRLMRTEAQPPVFYGLRTVAEPQAWVIHPAGSGDRWAVRVFSGEAAARAFLDGLGGMACEWFNVVELSGRVFGRFELVKVDDRLRLLPADCELGVRMIEPVMSDRPA